MSEQDPGLTSILIFGASGDLAQHKLLPSLFNLFRKGRLGARPRIWGLSRTPWSDEELRGIARENVSKACGSLFDSATWERFAELLRYRPADFGQARSLAAVHEEISAEARPHPDNRLYYLATVPALFPVLLEGLGAAGMAEDSTGFRRVVIEKPFGVDLESARRLNAASHASFREDQIYRIDHYLAKETVQNLLVFRFANSLFEPIWNRNHVESVHVFVSESGGVGGRAGYYEQAGILRDMFQNHLLQLLCLTALEPPARADADSLRNEKLKVLQAITPLDGAKLRSNTARGQYEGYRSEAEASPDSETATYGAIRLFIENWRWSGVPFILESGKALKEKLTEIVLTFRRPPLRLFRQSHASARPNAITFRLQPNEGVHLSFRAKEPGEGVKLRMVDMDFSYAEAFEPQAIWEAYERLLVDALQGDASLFMRADEIEQAWKLMDPVIAGWQSEDAPTLEIYRRGSWGPPGAERVRGGIVGPP